MSPLRASGIRSASLHFARPRALGLKVSDEFTIPLCRGHHRQLHQAGDETAWWDNFDINALEITKELWQKSRMTTFRSVAQQQAHLLDG
jgi:hypothetical protein